MILLDKSENSVIKTCVILFHILQRSYILERIIMDYEPNLRISRSKIDWYDSL